MLSQIVDAPAIFSTRHNLLDSATRKNTSQDRWENGVSFTPQGCFLANVQEVDCPPQLKPGFEVCPDPVTFLPFVVELGGEFMGHLNEGQLEKELDVHLSSAVERAVWEGTTATDPGTNPKFEDTPTLAATIAAGKGGSKEAVGLAEARLLELGQQGGTIHLSALDAADAWGVFFEDDGHLFTRTLRSPVIVGNYPPGFVFAHGGEIDVYVGEGFETATFEEMSANKFFYKVERLVLVAWNPCVTVMVAVTDSPASGYSGAITVPTVAERAEVRVYSPPAPAPVAESASEPEPVENEFDVPTDANTVIEIKAWLDEHGVDYASGATKSDLLLLAVKPTSTNTKLEIQHWLDARDIAYPATATKDELLDLVEAEDF